MAATRKTVEKAAADRGWSLVKVGSRYRLVDAKTGTVVADDWATDGGLTLSEVAQVLDT
jgi:hypothetical protein